MSRKEPLQQLFYQLKLRLGLIKPEPPDEIELLSKNPEKPKEYLALFSLKPKDKPEEVIGREEDLKMLQRAYRNWQLKHHPFLLVGEPGCGLSSFICAAIPVLEKEEPKAEGQNEPDAADKGVEPGSIEVQLLSDDYRIYDRQALLADLGRVLGLGEMTTIADLEEMVSKRKPVVLIFENIERLFLRTIGGFDLLEDLWNIVNATNDRIFWILTVSSYPLYYLDRITGIRTFFEGNSRYSLRPLDEALINSIIEVRNADYQPIFLKATTLSPDLERRLSRADGEAKQKLLRDHFFQQLHTFAGGNISRALFFWLESIHGFRDKKVYLRPLSLDNPRVVSTAVVSVPGEITHREVFALEAIFQHTSLSVSDMDRVLRSSEVRSRLIIAQLLQRNYIHPRNLRNDQQEYQINLLYQSELKKMLVNEFNRKIKMD